MNAPNSIQFNSIQSDQIHADPFPSYTFIWEHNIHEGVGSEGEGLWAETSTAYSRSKTVR